MLYDRRKLLVNVEKCNLMNDRMRTLMGYGNEIEWQSTGGSRWLQVTRRAIATNVDVKLDASYQVNYWVL